MTNKPEPSTRRGERSLLLVGLGGLLAVMIVFIIAIAIVARLEPTTGPIPDADEGAITTKLLTAVD